MANKSAVQYMQPRLICLYAVQFQFQQSTSWSLLRTLTSAVSCRYRDMGNCGVDHLQNFMLRSRHQMPVVVLDWFVPCWRCCWPYRTEHVLFVAWLAICLPSSVVPSHSPSSGSDLMMTAGGWVTAAAYGVGKWLWLTFRVHAVIARGIAAVWNSDTRQRTLVMLINCNHSNKITLPCSGFL